MLMSSQDSANTYHTKLSCGQYGGFSQPKIVSSGSPLLTGDGAPSSVDEGVSWSDKHLPNFMLDPSSLK